METKLCPLAILLEIFQREAKGKYKLQITNELQIKFTIYKLQISKLQFWWKCFRKRLKANYSRGLAEPSWPFTSGRVRFEYTNTKENKTNKEMNKTELKIVCLLPIFL